MRLDTSPRRRLPSLLRVAPLLVLLVSLPGLAISACGGEDSTSTGANIGLDQDVRLERAGYSVDVDADTLTLTMTRGDDELLRFPVDAFQLGAVDEITETYLYDPYPMLVESAFSKQPPGLRWLKPKRATLLEATSDAFEIRLTFDESKEAVLCVAAAADGRFRCQLTPSEQGVPVAVIRLQPRVDETEGFYGLGEYFDGVDHRGKVRAMQFEVDGSQESSYNEAHVPIPLLIGTRGWGLFVESFYAGLFDVASQQPDLVDVAFGLGSASTAGLTFHLMGAEHPLDVTKHDYEITGYPLLPARWALGPWVWRDENENQAQVESDMEELDGDTLVLTSRDGKEFTQGVVFEVIAVSGAPSSVQESGVEMIALGSVGELDQAATGWVYAPSERGGTLYVKVSSGDREVTVKF